MGRTLNAAVSGLGVRVLLWLVPALLLAWLPTWAGAAPPVDVRFGLHPTYGRLVVEWKEAITARSFQREGRLVVEVDAELPRTMPEGWRRLERFLAGVALDPAAGRIELDLEAGVVGRGEVLERRLLVVDLEAPERAPPLDLRVGRHDSYLRLVFEPLTDDPPAVRPTAEGARIALGRPLSAAARGRLERLGPPIRSAVLDGTTLDLALAAGTELRSFALAPDKFVVDLIDEQAAALAAAPNGAEPREARAAEDRAIDTVNGPEMVTEAGGVPAPPLPRPTGAEAARVVPEQWPVRADTLQLAARREGASLVLEARWPEPVPAAAFTRAGRLWLVFSARAEAIEADRTSLERHSPGFVSHVRQASHAEATVLSFDLEGDWGVEARRDGGTWRFRLAGSVAAPRPLPIERLAPEGALLVGAAVGTLTLEDGRVGDTLTVAPALASAAGVPASVTKVDLAFLPSAQGAVWQNRSDAVETEATAAGVRIRREGGLRLTPPRPAFTEIPTVEAEDGPAADSEKRQGVDIQAEHALDNDDIAATDAPEEAAEGSPSGEGAAAAGEGSLDGAEIPDVAEIDVGPPLGLAASALPEDVSLWDRRQAIYARLAEANEAARALARLELARLYLAQALPAEATLLTADAFADEAASAPALNEAHDLARRAVAGASALLMDRLETARQGLLDPAFDEDEELALWRAVLAAREEAWKRARRELERSARTLRTYPPALRFELGLEAAMIELENGRADPAFVLLDQLRQLDLTPEQRDRLRHVEAIARLRDGAVAEAVTMWRELAAEARPPLSLEATASRLAAEEEAGLIEPASVASTLEAMRPLWRGRRGEPAMLEQLARAQVAAGHPRAGLESFRAAVDAQPTPETGSGVVREMRALFRKLMAGDAQEELSALEKLALYRDFGELMPAGGDGDRLVRLLADALAERGYVTQAAALLDGQLEAGDGDPAARAETGLRLARLLLGDGRAERALEALASSDVGGAAPADIAGARRRLAAEALLGLGELEEAARMVAGEDGNEARRLRVRIALADRDWPTVIAEAEPLIEGRDAADAVGEAERGMILGLAIAHAGLGRRERVEALHERFGAGLDDATDRALLALLEEPADPGGAPEAILAAASEHLADLRGALDALDAR